MSIKAPKIANANSLIAVKGLRIAPVHFKNTGGAVAEYSIQPGLPLGFELTIENGTCVLSGTSMRVAEKTLYTITAVNAEGKCAATIEITVVEAPIKTQREAIIEVNDARQDLDTPRSQIENAMSDTAMMGSTIKPHEKFMQQPMGDDKRLSQQTANNPDAENRAQHNPELTPSPSQKLQAQAVARAAPPSPTPSPHG